MPQIEERLDVRIAFAKSLQTLLEERTGSSVYVDYEDKLALFIPKKDAETVFPFLRSFGEITSTWDVEDHVGCWLRIG